MPSDQLNAILAQKIEVAPGLAIIRVAPDGWELPDFVPGQFSVLGLPGSASRCPDSDPEEEPADPDKVIPRAYSIASSSVAKEYLEFYITLVHSGALTPRLLNLNIGDRLWLGPKITGRFTLDNVPSDANVVMIGTGTGIAPYMSMIRSLLTPETRRHTAIIHGAYHSWDLGYSSELVSLARVSSRLNYIPVVSHPHEEPVPWTGRSGFVQDVWTEGLLAEKWGFQPAPGDTHVLLCGHPGMVEAMVAILQGEGFEEHSRKSPGQIHLERYW